MAFVEVCEVAAVPEGDMKRYEIQDLELAIYHVGERFYATAAICTHERADLTLGELDGTTVVCPLHGAHFDIRTGRVLRPPAFKPLRIYPVRIEDGRVRVDLPPP